MNAPDQVASGRSPVGGSPGHHAPTNSPLAGATTIGAAAQPTPTPGGALSLLPDAPPRDLRALTPRVWAAEVAEQPA